MTTEPVTLSDWIHFLSSLVTLSNTIIFGTTSILVLLTVSLYLFSDWAQIILFLVLAIIIIVIYWFMYGQGSLYKKARVFLKEIMNGNKNDPEIIQKEWFQKREKKMFKDISVCVWKKMRDVTIGLGLAILIVGLLLMVIGPIDIADIYGQWIMTFGVSILTLGVAFHSIVIAKESDRRVKDIANANFLRVLSIFEDRRIDLQHPGIGPHKHPILIWKALVDMREAEELLDFCDIDMRHQGRLIDLMNHMFKYINRNYVDRLVCEEVRHLLAISQIGLKIDDEYLGKKNELTRLLQFSY